MASEPGESPVTSNSLYGGYGLLTRVVLLVRVPVGTLAGTLDGLVVFGVSSAATLEEEADGLSSGGRVEECLGLGAGSVWV